MIRTTASMVFPIARQQCRTGAKQHITILNGTGRIATVQLQRYPFSIYNKVSRSDLNSSTESTTKFTTTNCEHSSRKTSFDALTPNSWNSRTTHRRWSSTSRVFSTYSEADRNRITAIARDTQTPVSLQTLMRTGRGDFLHKTFAEATVEKHAATELVLRQVASFLRRELPVRMARRVADLESIPVLRDMVSVLQVRDAYMQSCMDILNYTSEIDSPAAEEEFSRLIETIYERHGSVLVQMARGAYEFRQAIRREKGSADIELEEETHEFLDRFYLCRIGIRVLIGQYLALRQPPVSNYIGIICSDTSPYEVVKRAIDDAAFMCTRKYGDAPEVIITGRLDLTFPYVPTHLRKSRNCLKFLFTSFTSTSFNIVSSPLMRLFFCFTPF
jgi:Mitochondrial branched-chain alpha-ketoacid dehydrogenase kinase